MVVAADDMGDRRIRVVGRDGQVVGGRAVASQDHEVFDLGVVELRGAVHQVFPRRDAVRDPEADREGLAGFGPSVSLCGGDPPRQRPRQPRHRAPSGRHGLGPGARELGLRGEVAIRAARLQQRQGVLPVPLRSGRLEPGPLVPVQPQPSQPVHDGVHVLGAAPVAVRVLDAQHEVAAARAGQQPVEERGAGAAHVQRPRGRGGEAKPHAAGAARRRASLRRSKSRYSAGVAVSTRNVDDRSPPMSA